MTPRICSVSNLKPGDVVVRLGLERQVASVIPNGDHAVVVRYTDEDTETFGRSVTVFRRRPPQKSSSGPGAAPGHHHAP